MDAFDPTRVDAVLFDVGNTLCYLDYPRLVRVLAAAGVLDARTPLDSATLAERRGRVRLSAWIASRGASTEAAETFHRYLELALEELAALTPGVVPVALDRGFTSLCLDHRRENFFGVPAPGVREALERLARRFRLAVVSNAGGSVGKKLAELDLATHLATVVDSGLEGIEKPDPRIFLRGCERAGVEPSRAVYVGDLEAIDVVGARAAGLQPVLLDPAGAYAAAGCTATLVPDVVALAARLLAGR